MSMHRNNELITKNIFSLLECRTVEYHLSMDTFSIAKTLVVIGTLAIAVALYWYLYE